MNHACIFAHSIPICLPNMVSIPNTVIDDFEVHVEHIPNVAIDDVEVHVNITSQYC